MNEVIVAPFSNSDIRDWPIGHFAQLLGLLLEDLPGEIAIRVIGTANQRMRACEIVRYHPADRVTNECGRWNGQTLASRLSAAHCAISNNSGIGHLAGYLGVPTVCIFGGSHPRHEWRPLGQSVVLVSRVIGCSPCHLDHGGKSPYDKACLREIEPRAVANAVRTATIRSSVT